MPLDKPDTIYRLPLPVILISADRKLLAANRKAQMVFLGFKKGADLSHMIDSNFLLEACSRAIEKNVDLECEFVRIKRQRRTFQAHVTVNVDAQGSAYIVIYETTEAREAERMRASFVADVSHELRSPLTTLIATIETLKGRAGEVSEVRARFIEIMAEETSRMHGIVDDLLSLSATEAIEHIMPEQNVNLSPLVANIVKVLTPKAELKNMGLKLVLESETPDIRGEYDELYQAIYNLADNAVKYGHENTDVTLTAEKRGSEIILSVHNHGTPIPAKHIPRLTERFYRVDKSRSRDLGGTGLGLAIVKHIVSRHLGGIIITSSEEEGTVFAVNFPLPDSKNTAKEAD
jgi:two-component system phosphate regulon sensor histidine kinase PhoR